MIGLDAPLMRSLMTGAEIVARVAEQNIAPAQVNATTHVNAPVLQIDGTNILQRANTWSALNTFERSVNATTDLMIARNANAGSSAIAVSRVRNDANVEGRWLVGGSANTTAVVGAITRSNMVELTASGTGLQALLTGTLVAGAPMIFVTGGYNERMRLLDAGLAIGATALVGSERVRIAGGAAALRLDTQNTGGQPSLLAMAVSGGEVLDVRYTEAAVGSVPVDVFQFRRGGAALRPIVITSGDAAPEWYFASGAAVSYTSQSFAIGTTALVGSERARVAGGSAATSGATDVLLGGGVLDFGTSLRYRGIQVVGARQTGWAAATGTAIRTTFATSTVTTEQLAQRVKALIDDLTTHGLIGT
jgi:hypothetical protein